MPLLTTLPIKGGILMQSQGGRGGNAQADFSQSRKMNATAATVPTPASHSAANHSSRFASVGSSFKEGISDSRCQL
ncbi:hypothetical protein BRAS3843_3100008 [Bradyrhizobium sp. STM 3843]|nr:hypothetical protein BRAS3843_3100008 [Bradyrhizobium sp. STM 3843]